MAQVKTICIEALERQLKKGDKALVGNKGYRRNYPRPISEFFHAACQIRKSLNP